MSGRSVLPRRLSSAIYDGGRRLAELAKSRGRSDGDLARELIERSVDDLDDIQMAVARLEKRESP
jgi:predicted DNA-binding protein